VKYKPKQRVGQHISYQREIWFEYKDVQLLVEHRERTIMANFSNS
jgi:hypothetical protein